MVSLEQVRALEERVERAVSLIAALKAETAELSSRLARAEEAGLAAQTRATALESAKAGLEGRAAALEAEARLQAARAASLEAAAEAFRDDQARIEEGIVHALEKLDAFQDLVLGAEIRPAPPRSGPPAAAEVRVPVERVDPDELSLEELEAATAPDSTPAATPVGEGDPAPRERPAPPSENELDIF